jgi:hypothetical protein
MIERHFATERAVAKFEQVIFQLAGKGEGFFSEADCRREGGTALRLQSQENASRFQDRCFPLPVPADEKIEARPEFDPKRFEAAKIPELKFSEHNSSNYHSTK